LRLAATSWYGSSLDAAADAAAEEIGSLFAADNLAEKVARVAAVFGTGAASGEGAAVNAGALGNSSAGESEDGEDDVVLITSQVSIDSMLSL
jgi:hypothetical protein